MQGTAVHVGNEAPGAEAKAEVQLVFGHGEIHGNPGESMGILVGIHGNPDCYSEK